MLPQKRTESALTFQCRGQFAQAVLHLSVVVGLTPANVGIDVEMQQRVPGVIGDPPAILGRERPFRMRIGYGDAPVGYSPDQHRHGMEPTSSMNSPFVTEPLTRTFAMVIDGIHQGNRDHDQHRNDCSELHPTPPILKASRLTASSLSRA
jgi:hypothetical protein